MRFKRIGLNMKRMALMAFWMAFNISVFSQPFTFIDAGFVQIMQGESGWKDFNKDGYPDVFITGVRYSGNDPFISSHLYKNKHKGTFDFMPTGIPDVYLSAFDWADFDKDGDEDLIITGETKDKKLIAAIYRNNQTHFSLMNSNFAPVRNGSVNCGDYDNDGDQDILLTGESTNGSLVTKIYRNNGNGSFTDIQVGMVSVFNSDAVWIDFDNDKDLDIIIAGETYNKRIVGKIYRNDENDSFSEVPYEIVALKQCSIKVGDFNNDNNTDFICTGETYGNRMITVVYRNNGSKGFSQVSSAIDGARAGNIDLGDYDRDGDLDVLITGESYNWAITKVYRNDGNFVFTDIFAAIPGVSLGGAYWGDYDRDGDLDILLTGLDNCYDFNAKLFRNDGVYKAKIVEKEEESGSIWITQDMNITRPLYYYFVYASCYCDPFDEGKKGFHAFISNVHRSERQYELMERFNDIVLNNLVNWPKVDAGHRVSIGFITKNEAEEGRIRVMEDYKDEGFIIHYVNW